MASHQMGERVTTATATLPPELRHHWVKRLARAMGVPMETARHWAFRRVPDARRREIALALVAECDRLQAVIDETRNRWKEIADEAARPVARRETDRSGPQARRVGRAGLVD